MILEMYTAALVTGAMMAGLGHGIASKAEKKIITIKKFSEMAIK